MSDMNQANVTLLSKVNQPMERTTERENFYRWIATCPLTNYEMCDANSMSVSYKFQFNSPEPDIDELYDQVLSDLQR